MNAFSKAAIATLLVAAVSPIGWTIQKETPEQATALVAKAQAQAKKESKAVFVVFDASW